jgi:prophage DNA circulation protein
MLIFFHGEDHDFDAEAFTDSLDTTGVGVLDHPVWGPLDVVPVGGWGERNDLKTGANQTVFEVTFFSTIGLDFPESDVFTSDAILVSLGEYNTAAALEFESAVDTSRAVQRAVLAAEYTLLREQVSLALQPLAAAQEDVRLQFDAINSSLALGVAALITSPKVLARQTTLLVQAPARARAASIASRVEAYGALVSEFIGADAPGSENAFQLQGLFAQAAVSGYALATVNAQFETRTQALLAAEGLLEVLADTVGWQDTQRVALGVIDTGAAYQQLQKVVALVAGFLVQVSFSLKRERRLVLDRRRTTIDVAAELLGSVSDETLDALAEANNLSGSELLELPRGRAIVYYR